MVHKKNVSYVTVNAKIMPARGKRACSLFPKHTISYAKVHNKFVIAVIFNYF